MFKFIKSLFKPRVVIIKEDPHYRPKDIEDSFCVSLNDTLVLYDHLKRYHKDAMRFLDAAENEDNIYLIKAYMGETNAYEDSIELVEMLLEKNGIDISGY